MADEQFGGQAPLIDFADYAVNKQASQDYLSDVYGMQKPPVMEPPSPMQVQPPDVGVSPMSGQIGGPQDIQATVNSLQSQIPQEQMETPPPQPSLQIAPSGMPVQPQIGAKPALSPEQQYSQQMQDIMKKQKASNETLGNAAQEKIKFEKEQAEKLAAQAQLDIAAQQAKQEERKAVVDGEMKKLSGIQEEFKSAMGQKLDPNHYWESKDTGQKVMAGIAIMLGGLAGGMSGKGGNVAMDIIHKGIDRDVDAQKFNIQKAQEGKLKEYDLENNMLAQMYKKFGNEDQAEAATRLLRLQQAQYLLNANASKYAAPEVQERTKQANMALDTQMAGLKYQIANVAAQKAAQQQLGQVLNGQQAANLPPSVIQQLPKEMRENYVPGYGFAPNKNSGEEFQKMRQTVEPAISGIDRINTLLKDFNRVTDIKKKAQIGTEMKAVAGQLRVPFTGPGALTEKEYERLMDTLGDPTSITSLQEIQKAKLNQVQKKLKSDLQGYATQYGLPIQAPPNAIRTFKPGQ